MRVLHLSLTDFRNYTTAEVGLARGPNLFVGSNGQGKTNLVESLGYLSSLGSHRVSSDAALIRQGADSAIVRARLEADGRELLAEVQINRSSANRAQINRGAIKPRELPRYFTSVLFAPEDLALVRGEPSGRRRFLDELLVARSPRFAGVQTDYERVLKQRNTLLKSARASGVKAGQLGTLDIWDERLVALGSELIIARDRLAADLAPEVARAYAAVAGEDHRARLATVLSIRGSVPDDETAAAAEVPDEAIPAESVADVFREALARVRPSELDRGLTLVGPHRDDLFLSLNGLPARGYASHGESWSFALALKLASAAVVRSESATGDPVIVLDDVFAELDGSRRERLADEVAGYEQVLITAAVEGDVPQRLKAHTVRIAAGTIVDEATP
ncbi:DNA replication/repair protein RecF [Frigoribacterium sp. CFBP9039]|uniref:DNA replication/repair protein RecF n=1 Tax=Frigoribacterium TaxID=96492 RepID=UPI0017836CED|nr:MULTISPECIES: DNA replication/repair protein RecF [Frigoribacterium]MBD8704356.1 DNA replication/repair protein RecF [Frigoribacterium sp. CFBP 13712]MCJ0699884.1 DNA replication/repair protein RecF [Frigoribacterium faeni]MDY0891610.1 DNA replication/repair protein RecF [Frigoribacterium sp. CFBP9030]MDY0945793.1 DNA replication/repair protein RecF [Frigoribacterium sp. CFBP9039]